MTIAIGDLVARFRADTSDIERGGQVAKQTLQGVEQQAGQTARALEIMAAQFAKLHGGSAADALQMFQRSGAQPTAAALEQAARAMDGTASAAARAVEPTRATARAATEMGQGFEVSGSSLVRFAGGLAGIGLGISLVAGTARLLHDTIRDTVEAQIDWERSLVRVRDQYGQLGTQVLAIANQQANTPGLLGSGPEFVSAALNARYLSTRYGLQQEDITGLTSAAGRASYALGYNEQQRRDLQDRFLQFALTGGRGLASDVGIEGEDIFLTRQIGGVTPAQLQALTPSEIAHARVLAAEQGAAHLALVGGQDRPGLLAAATGLEAARASAQTRLGQYLEGDRPAIAGQSELAQASRFPLLGGYSDIQQQRDIARQPELEKALADATDALNANKAAIDASTKSEEDYRNQLAKIGVEVGGAAFALLGFAGNPEDRYSIARGDVGAQLQATVAARARMAIPAFGVTQGEIVATAQNTAYQNAYQNFVAQQAQQEQGNAIREDLERRVQTGPANQRAAAQRALDQARASEPIQQRLGEAGKAAALVDLQTQETQSKLEAITLTQRERGIQLLRDTVDLRKLDVQQQQIGLAATMSVVRAQQSALPSQYRLADAQFGGNLAQAVALQRMARVLQGKDVSGLPSPEELFKQYQQSQFAAAEAGPGALVSAHAVELAQRTATSAGLAEQLTSGQLRSADLANDLKNLGDLPSQTALEFDLVQHARDSLVVQKEIRDDQKDLIRIVTGRAPSATSGQGVQDIANRIARELFGDDGSDPPAPPEMPGNRRGPF